MTKRTVEATLQDELASAERDVATAVGKLEKAVGVVRDSIAARDVAQTSMQDAEARVIRARNALAALTGKSLDELLEETKTRQETTGTHDPTDFDPTSLADPANREGVSEPTGEPEVVSPKRAKKS